MFSLIFAILLMLNENYVARAEDEHNTKQIITRLLNEVENQQADVKDLLDEIQNIRLKLPQLREDISSALAKNSLLIEGKDALAEGKAKGDNVSKCQALFDLKMEWLVHKIYQYVIDSIKGDLDYVEDSLKSIGEELNKVKNDLEELQSSNSNSDSHDFNELVANLNECSEKVIKFKTRIPHLVENILHDLEKEEAPILVRNNIFLPVIECL